mgnify:CR=1 FL=1
MRGVEGERGVEMSVKVDGDEDDDDAVCVNNGATTEIYTYTQLDALQI